MSGPVSRVAVDAVRAWDPRGLDAGARALHGARAAMEGLRARLRTIYPDETVWRGQAGEQARAAHAGHDARLRAVADRLGELTPLVTTAADTVADLQGQLRRLETMAQESGYAITSDATV